MNFMLMICALAAAPGGFLFGFDTVVISGAEQSIQSLGGLSAAGQAFGSSTRCIFAALLTLFFPTMTERMAPGTIFAFFCFMMCLQWLWVRFMMHETKGAPLEKMMQELGIESSE